MALDDHGWKLFEPSSEISGWIAYARGVAANLLKDPLHGKWYRYGGTWFAGVNVLPNDETGGLPGGPALAGPPVDFIRHNFPVAAKALDRGQLSVCFPGYPRPMADETAATFAYRVKRDGAHVDGLHREGSARRRFLRESHAFIWGIPLVDVAVTMSPLVVWEGSHLVIRQALEHVLAGVAPAVWPEIDLTEAYHAARRQVFATCRRVEITTRLGQSYLVHRLALHGMAPWAGEDAVDELGRAIVYFRPLMPQLSEWLSSP
jgi:hypothetical protein